ncbi:MAG: hypothetical protein EOM14_05615 [Clostridia bacterium]|nr:hypothetical protein [Clostridia bacterium]
MAERKIPRKAYRSGKKPKKRGRFGTLVLFLLFITIAVIVVLKVGGVIGGGSVKVPTNNIKVDFSVDFEVLSAQIETCGGSFSASQSDIDTLRSVAEKQTRYSEEIQYFIDHLSAYSQMAVDTVILSPEKIAFVLLEPFADRQGYDSGVVVKKGTVPYFIQYDSRWGFAEYGSGAIGYTACGPTCLAMAAAGITGDESFTPLYVSEYAEKNGYYVSGTGTAWSLFTDGASGLGLVGEEIAADEFDMYKRLRHGEVIIASMSDGDFTHNGHFIVFYGYSLGAFKVYDPSSIERSSRTWSIEQLNGQIAQLWSISAA